MHLDDFWSFREFACSESWQHPCNSVFQENIKSLGEETWGEIPELEEFKWDTVLDTMAAHELAASLERAVGLLRKIIDQTERRVIRREKVPAVEKIVPFFEEHTDIIVKGGRYTEYGRTIFLTGGPSTLILDCMIE